nr:EamA family transporter [uncultured Mediterraneibacter sp.]
MEIMVNTKQQRMKDFLFLHLCILWYTMTSILSKAASRYPFLSFKYLICFAGIFITLGSYAILWQQVIKRFKPSVGYSNKSVSLIWTMFFSALIFNERITLYNIIGAVIIITGVILVAQDE